MCNPAPNFASGGVERVDTMKPQALVASKVAMYPGKRRNAHFFENLSNDLCLGIHNPIGLSPTNIKYSKYFYELYSYRQQPVDGNEIDSELIKVPWGHHVLIIGKSRGDRDKALFYVRKTIEGGWSRTDLSVAISERLYEKTGKAATEGNCRNQESGGQVGRCSRRNHSQCGGRTNWRYYPFPPVSQSELTLQKLLCVKR